MVWPLHSTKLAGSDGTPGSDLSQATIAPMGTVPRELTMFVASPSVTTLLLVMFNPLNFQTRLAVESLTTASSSKRTAPAKLRLLAVKPLGFKRVPIRPVLSRLMNESKVSRSLSMRPLLWPSLRRGTRMHKRNSLFVSVSEMGAFRSETEKYFEKKFEDRV